MSILEEECSPERKGGVFARARGIIGRGMAGLKYQKGFANVKKIRFGMWIFFFGCSKLPSDWLGESFWKNNRSAHLGRAGRGFMSPAD